MGARETASRQNHQPLPAHLDLSALLTLRSMSGCEEFEARFSPCLREGVKKPELKVRINPNMEIGGWTLPVFRSPDHRITRSPDSRPWLTLSPRPRSCARQQHLSNPLASGLSSLESRRLAAPTPAASVPLTVKPFEINGSSGPTAWRPFFLRRVKLPPVVPCFFTPSPRHGLQILRRAARICLVVIADQERALAPALVRGHLYC